MDPVRLSLALGPLAVYFLMMGVIHLARRPFLTTGGRDLAALGVAVSGLVIIGPIELFLPRAAAMNFGALVWLLLIAFYVLCLTLVVLIGRPRLVIYNISVDELRPVLAEVVATLDTEARWAGNSLSLPRLGVELHVDPFPAMNNVSLVAAHDEQNFRGWRRLEQTLALALARTEVTVNPRGVGMLMLALAMIATMYVELFAHPAAVAEAVRGFLFQ